MPVEHEYKFILVEDTSELQKKLHALYPQQLIHQVYCTKNNRFRAIVRTGLKGKVKTQWVHTFKKKINGKLLEVETNVDYDDFKLITEGENLGSLYKIRYSIPQEHGQWDIDFLLTDSLALGGTQYFALAECEQPEGLPIEYPDLIKPYIRYEVPHGNSSLFSNFKLSDTEYARIAIDKNSEHIRLWENV